jgi:orotidine-5'-phosphate decarboxylase
MLRAVSQEVTERTRGTVIPLAVTVLTSSLDPNNDTLKLARLAESCGIAGIISSPQNLVEIKSQTKLTIITPGVRSVKDSNNDQKRIMSYKEAIDFGSDGLVIGRVVTQAANPIDAIEKIYKDLNY